MRSSGVVIQCRVLTSCLGYPPANLASAEENKAPIRKGGTKTKGGTTYKQKGAKVTGAKGEDNSDVETGSDSSESLESDSFNQVDENSELDEPSSSEVELQSASDPELVLEKKAPSARKPSKRAIETALSEVSRALKTSWGGVIHFPEKATHLYR